MSALPKPYRWPIGLCITGAILLAVGMAVAFAQIGGCIPFGCEPTNGSILLGNVSFGFRAASVLLLLLAAYWAAAVHRSKYILLILLIAGLSLWYINLLYRIPSDSPAWEVFDPLVVLTLL